MAKSAAEQAEEKQKRAKELIESVDRLKEICESPKLNSKDLVTLRLCKSRIDETIKVLGI